MFNAKTLVGIALSAVVLAVVGLFLWKDLSKRYRISFRLPFKEARPINPARKTLNGNVCVLDKPDIACVPYECADIQFFPRVYEAMGVNSSRMVEWQNSNGFDSGGIDRFGHLLAPGYPIFSRIAFSTTQPVYLKGEDLRMLLEETVRVSEATRDPVALASLRRLAHLASEALTQSRTLRVT